ncbi:hypothetical protein BX616_007821, partial [Lobosporangium transversale]
MDAEVERPAPMDVNPSAPPPAQQTLNAAALKKSKKNNNNNNNNKEAQTPATPAPATPRMLSYADRAKGKSLLKVVSFDETQHLPPTGFGGLVVAYPLARMDMRPSVMLAIGDAVEPIQISISKGSMCAIFDDEEKYARALNTKVAIGDTLLCPSRTRYTNKLEERIRSPTVGPHADESALQAALNKLYAAIGTVRDIEYGVIRPGSKIKNGEVSFTLALHDTTLPDTELIRAASLFGLNTVFTWETAGKFCYNCGSLTHLTAECRTPRTLYLEEIRPLFTPILAPRYGKETTQAPPRVVVKSPTTTTTAPPTNNNKRPPTSTTQANTSSAPTTRLDPDGYQTQGRKRRMPPSKASSNATATSSSKPESNSRKNRKKQRAQKKAKESGKKLESKQTSKEVSKTAPVAANATSGSFT